MIINFYSENKKKKKKKVFREIEINNSKLSKIGKIID